jgi:acyl carrier protein
MATGFISSLGIELFTEYLSIDTVNEWDSMSCVGLILAFQKEFAVSILPADAIGLTSVKNTIQYLTNQSA